MCAYPSQLIHGILKIMQYGMFTSYTLGSSDHSSCPLMSKPHSLQTSVLSASPFPVASPSPCSPCFPILQSAGSVPPPCPRSGHSACLLPDARGLVILGGIDFASEAVYNDVHVLDTGKHTHTWHVKAANLDQHMIRSKPPIHT